MDTRGDLEGVGVGSVRDVLRRKAALGNGVRGVWEAARIFGTEPELARVASSSRTGSIIPERRGSPIASMAGSSPGHRSTGSLASIFMIAAAISGGMSGRSVSIGAGAVWT